MGRYLSEIDRGDVWKGFSYPERPVWEFVGFGTAAGTHHRSVFGKHSDVNYLELLKIGELSGAKVRGNLRHNDETAQTYFIIGHASSGVTSAAFSPQTSKWGITGFADTACCNNWFSAESGEFGYVDGLDVANLLRYSAPVIPLANKNHNYDLLVNGQAVKLIPTGGSFALHGGITAQSCPGFINLFDLPGWQNAEGFEETNNAMACYNAKSGVFVVFYRTGTSGANYRAHVIPIGYDVLHKRLTADQLRAIFVKGMENYSFFDLSLTGLTRTATSAEMYALNLTLCNDNTLWIVATDSPNTSGTGYVRLYSLTTPITELSGQLDMEPENTVNTASYHYSLQTGAPYKTRYMLSDDNKVTAVYTHYHYYCAGAVGYFLNNESAVVDGKTHAYRVFSYADTSYGFGIAPIGDSRFMFSWANNMDGANAYVWQVDPLNDQAQNGHTYSTYNNTVVRGVYSMPSQSTMYQAFFVNKIMPLSDFK